MKKEENGKPITKKEQIQLAVKKNKWDKGSFYYATSQMNKEYFPESMYSYKELKEKFYREILFAEKWNRIKHFTTFKGIN